MTPYEAQLEEDRRRQMQVARANELRNYGNQVAQPQVSYGMGSTADQPYYGMPQQLQSPPPPMQQAQMPTGGPGPAPPPPRPDPNRNTPAQQQGPSYNGKPLTAAARAYSTLTAETAAETAAADAIAAETAAASAADVGGGGGGTALAAETAQGGASGATAAGGGEAASSGAGWWALLVAAIIANEMSGASDGRRPNSFGSQLGDIATGKVVEEDSDYMARHLRNGGAGEDREQGNSAFGDLVSFSGKMMSPESHWSMMKDGPKEAMSSIDSETKDLQEYIFPWKWF